MIIYFFILLNWNSLIPPPPPNRRINDVCSKRMTWGSTLLHWFLGEEMRYTGGGDRYIYYSKKGHFIEVSEHFRPSL